MASVIDYLGFIGLLLALLAIGLAVVGYLGVKVDNVNRLWFASGALALVAAALGLLLAVNEHGVPEPQDSPGPMVDGSLPGVRRSWRAAMRMTERGSSTTMRILGALTIVAGRRPSARRPTERSAAPAPDKGPAGRP